jgi:hypothetical protein
MSGAKVVIDSKLSDVVFREFLEFLESQEPKVFPPANLEISFFSAEIFSTTTRPKMGCVFFFFLKNTVYIQNEKQNTEDRSEGLIFCSSTHFVKAAKLFQNNISRNQKKHAPQFS